MEDVKVTYSTINKYREHIKGNQNEDEVISILKMIRNWNVADIEYENDEVQVKNYGNLEMTLFKDSMVINGLYNYKNVKGLTDEKFGEVKNKAKEMNRIMGIDDVKEHGLYIDGYRIMPRCYKNYIHENGFEKYYDLLNKCIEIIDNGEKIHSYNDKEFYELGDTHITLTQGKYITKIKVGGDIRG